MNHLHRCMPVELLDEPDHGKRIVPLNTGRVQIGIAYQPKPSATDARCIERYTAARSPLARWVGWCAAALFFVYVIARQA